MPDDGKRPDLIGIMHEGFEEARDKYVEGVRGLRADVKQPIDPSAKKLTATERRAADAAFLADPLLVAGEADAQSARFRLPANKPIPRRVWERVKRAAREEPHEDS